MVRSCELGGCLAYLGFCQMQKPGPQLGVVLLGALEVLGGAPSDAGSDEEELCLTVSRSSPVSALTETRSWRF